MKAPGRRLTPQSWLIVLGLFMTQALAALLIFHYAPTEVTMGHVQRILYLHVAAAWCGLMGCLAMAACAGVYLARRRLVLDHWSQAAAETSWLCVTLTLVTGSFWAHEAWGSWWIWEPRLTSMLLLWLFYAGIFLVRTSTDDPHQRARIGAVLAIVSAANLPLVIMATRWFRGVHPVSPTMDPRMYLVLVAAVLSLVGFIAFVTIQRRRQLGLLEEIAQLEVRLETAQGY